MKIKEPILRLRSVLVFLFVMAVALLTSCSDDPQSTNEEEVITMVTVELAPVEGDTVFLVWDDTNLDGIVDESEISDDITLAADKTYKATIQIWNNSTSRVIDVTEEVREEAEDHIFCFEITGLDMSIPQSSLDKDSNGLPLGITSSWVTDDASTGTINISLRHQPGVKTGDCPGAGDTDVDLTFPLSIQAPVGKSPF